MPKRTKNDVFGLNKVKNGPKRPYDRPKRAKNVWKKAKNRVFGPKKPMKKGGRGHWLGYKVEVPLFVILIVGKNILFTVGTQHYY